MVHLEIHLDYHGCFRFDCDAMQNKSTEVVESGYSAPVGAIGVGAGGENGCAD
jgi:hypothetical protein